jgi:CBS domain-containing protein
VVDSVRHAMIPEPWTIDAGATLDDAARVMRSWDTREVLVTDNGELRGVLTDSSIVVTAIASGRAPSTITAGECATRHVPRLRADQPLSDALDYMRRHDVHRLPVVDGNRLVGTAWLADLAARRAPLSRP